MADIILSSCCYNQLVYSATNWTWTTAPLTYFEISEDTNIPDGCYVSVTGVTAFGPYSFSGNATTLMTDCNDPLCIECCDENLCINIPIETYSGYNGTYNINSSYNAKPYWTGGTEVGYIFYDNTKWCLSNSLGGSCIFYGSNPTNPNDLNCPDLDSSILTFGTCVPTPTPYDPCSVLSFDVVLDCAFPTPTLTPTPTPTPTQSPTPTPTIDVCNGFTAEIVLQTITATPTPSPTPTPTPCYSAFTPPMSSVTYLVDSGKFICSRVKELSVCDSFEKFYVVESIEFEGNQLPIGTTILAVISDQIKCVTYTNDIFGSTNGVLEYVYTAYTSGCTSCIVPTATPTPTPTATPTPTPTLYPMGTQFIFTSCTSNTMIIQTAMPPLNLCETNIIKDNNGDCWEYVTNVVGYYPTVGFITSNQDVFTATTATTYSTCIECFTPTPTPTPVYKEWSVKGSYTVACPVCELTNFGSSIVIYTSSSVENLEDGVLVYKNSSLTTPLSVDYIKYGDYIYEVDDSTGKITQKCKVNGFCK